MDKQITEVIGYKELRSFIFFKLLNTCFFTTCFKEKSYLSPNYVSNVILAPKFQQN